MNLGIIFLSLIVFLIIIFILIFIFYIYKNRNDNEDKINQNQDVKIDLNKDNINTLEGQIKKINELENEIKEIKKEINDFKSKLNFNGWKEFIINNKKTIIDELDNLQGENAGEYKIAFDEIKEKYDNMFIVLSKEDDQYRQVIYDYKVKNKLF